MDSNKIFELADERFQQENGKQKELIKFAVPDTLVIKLINACNLRCDYCYMGHNLKTIKMDSTLLFKIIKETDEILNSPITIYLHGGEPLLAWDLIESLGERVINGYFRNSIYLRIQTNGTLVNRDIMKGFKKYGIQVGISIDGYNDETNGCRLLANGASCTDLILNTIKALNHNGISCGVLSVMNKKNINEQWKLLSELTNLGVKEYVFNPLVPWGEAIDKVNLVPNTEEIIESYKNIIDFIVEYNLCHSKDKWISERNLRWIGKGLFQNTKGYMCMQSPCGAGIRTATFGANGSVYLCDQMYGDERFYLGNVIDQRLTDIFSQKDNPNFSIRRVENIDKCATCQWKYVCSGGCTALSYYTFGGLHRESALCDVYKIVIPYIYKKIYLNRLQLDILG